MRERISACLFRSDDLCRRSCGSWTNRPKSGTILGTISVSVWLARIGGGGGRATEKRVFTGAFRCGHALIRWAESPDKREVGGSTPPRPIELNENPAPDTPPWRGFLFHSASPRAEVAVRSFIACSMSSDIAAATFGSLIR